MSIDILNAKKIKMFLTEDREECLMYYGDFIFKKWGKDINVSILI